MTLMQILLKCFIAGFLLFSAKARANETEYRDSLLTYNIKEVIVTGQSARQRILGSERLDLAKLALTPQLFGETDIIKSITLLPGVHGEADGAGGFEVRGGNAYQNLVTLDGMAIYNPAHLMGIFSTFNDDAMAGAKLHNGPVPAEFGGASSSVLETFMKAGDKQTYDFSGTIGLLNAKVAASGPIVKDKLSFSASARRSYFDLFLKCSPDYKTTVLNFYDVNAKIHYNVNATNSVSASFFMARDNMSISDMMAMDWGNIAGSMKWNSFAGDRWQFTTTAAMTKYDTDAKMDIMDVSQQIKGHIRSLSLNEKVNYQLSEGLALDFGFRSELLDVTTGEGSLNGSRFCDRHSGWQNSVWINYSGTPTEWLTLKGGVRATLFSVVTGKHLSEFVCQGEESPDFSHKTYFDLEPRVTLTAALNDCHDLKAGASITTQNIHGILSTFTSFPSDRYALTSATVKPERSLLLTLGYAGMTGDGGWDWTAEVYLKSVSNVYDYDDGMSMFSRVNLESIISGGKGRGYGFELMVRKNVGKLKGWLSYTLSKNETKIDGINDSRWYRASNDRRHNISIVGIYSVSQTWDISATWTFSSGHPLTAPDLKYEIGGMTAYYYSARNSYITSPSHRLDLSATYTHVGKKFTSVLSFGLFNVYNHYSPFVVFFEDDPSKPSGTRAVQQSLFGILPSISYTVKF